MPNDLLNISLDEELVTYRRRRMRNDRKAPFFICGIGGTNRNGDSMNVIETLASTPSASIKLFSAMLKARVVETNQVLRSVLSQQPGIDARYIDNHMPGLIEARLVKRVQRGIYLINPNAVMPPNGIAAKAQWSSLMTDEDSSGDL